MKILAIDTSSMISSCSIMEDGLVIGDYNVNQKKTHSESLLVMIDQLLDQLDMKISEIDLYAVCEGPGSFTGLRIGMTVAKTFAQVFDKPIVGVSSLAALANVINTDKKIIPLLDARGGRVYYSVFKNDGKLERLSKDDLCYIEDLLAALKDDEEYIFVGEGVRAYRDEIKELKNTSFANEALNNLLTRSICDIADRAQAYDNLYSLSPDYVRKSQAQRDLDLKNKNAD
ncbi:MAG: tRNA (adenosine(37)-N6)-threonylcarbamoyltransferase complex dimerization subunit type 1 TsaB [Finegoldia sp.]|nr:tRNA (adenosine(37)-N6)-threonylcarbamoyltransferase complex dimerization subunit type 1 TsaB [Finegoldia sp.]